MLFVEVRQQTCQDIRGIKPADRSLIVIKAENNHTRTCSGNSFSAPPGGERLD